MRVQERFGDGNLEKQAEALDKAKALKNKGKNMASFDDMLHKFQMPSKSQYNDVTPATHPHATTYTSACPT